MHQPTPEQHALAKETAQFLIGLLGSLVHEEPLGNSVAEVIASKSAAWWSHVASVTCGVLLVALDEPALRGRLNSGITVNELRRQASINLKIDQPPDIRVSDLVAAYTADPTAVGILKKLHIAAALTQAIATAAHLNPDVVIVRTAVDATAYAITEGHNVSLT